MREEQGRVDDSEIPSLQMWTGVFVLLGRFVSLTPMSNWIIVNTPKIRFREYFMSIAQMTQRDICGLSPIKVNWPELTIFHPSQLVLVGITG